MIYKCANCGANLNVKDEDEKVACQYCGTQVIVKNDDDPFFGNNMTSQKFWDNRAAKMQAELNKIPGFAQQMAKTNLINTPYDSKKDNVYRYNGDVPLENNKLDILTAEKKHLFAYADLKSIETLGISIKDLMKEKKFEEIYGYLSNIKQIPRAEAYGCCSGIIRSVFYCEPHNDFYELSDGLSCAMFSFRRYNSPENIKIGWISIYICYFSEIAAHLFSESTNYSDQWFKQTFLRLFYYAEIFLCLSPMTNFIKDERVKNAVNNMIIGSKGILIKLKALSQNDKITLNKIDNIEKLFQNTAKTLKLKL